MARLPRIIVPGLAHYVTQRGNRGQPIFFEQSDYSLYRDLVAEHCRRAAVDVWAYCLMPDHVHLVVVPTTGEGLARAIGEAHRKYTAFVNARARCSGHLFQARFASVVMDADHALAAIGHVARNPVRTGRGRARARISPAATTGSYAWRLSSGASDAFPTCWRRSRIRPRSRASRRRKRSAGRSARTISSHG